MSERALCDKTVSDIVKRTAGRAGPRLSFARLAARAARADRMAKGLERGDAWDELALLAVELCGLRPLPWLRAG